jgi:hypothetical protein
MVRRSSLALVTICCAAGAFCWAAEPNAEPPLNKTSINKGFAQRLLQIAHEYQTYGRLDNRARWAPTLCASPSQVPMPSAMRMSKSDDQGTHGKKLYYVFAKDRPDYLHGDPRSTRRQPDANHSGTSHAIGQVIVKEAWVPEKLTRATNAPASLVPATKVGNELYHAKEKAGLFIIYKLAEDTPDTDRGWVYGTVSADGITVTSAGKMQSCMACHDKAPRDRLFGMKYDAQ